MQTWLKLSMILCVFGFIKELRPSEPYIYDFLIGSWRNLTSEQIIQEVYPIATYSNLILLVFVFLVTDWCKYKPLIMASGLCGIVVWSLLLWSSSFVALQIIEVFYGAFVAVEVAYYTYIYAKVDKRHFQAVTSHTRAAVLAGRAMSGFIAQFFYSTGLLDLRQLNYVTFCAMLAATFWSVLLPSAKSSIYFHKPKTTDIRHKNAFILMLGHLKHAFGHFGTLKWSMWWALASAGFFQVNSYIQPLYDAIQNDYVGTYNGAAEALVTLLGFAAAISVAHLRIDRPVWQSYNDLILAMFSLLQGIALVISASTSNVIVCYILYIAFGVMYHFMITVASTLIACHIIEDSYGLIFGINTFVALVLNSILTTLVTTKGVGFELPPREQFVVYGWYHIGTAIIFAGAWMSVARKESCSKRLQNRNLEDATSEHYSANTTDL